MMPRPLCPPYSNFKQETKTDWVSMHRAKRTNDLVINRCKFNASQLQPGFHQLGAMPNVSGFNTTQNKTKPGSIMMRSLDSIACKAFKGKAHEQTPEALRDQPSRLTAMSIDSQPSPIKSNKSLHRARSSTKNIGATDQMRLSIDH